ncbi:MAG: sodium:proton antiporter, partial [Planctomycetota bacterium]
LTPLGDPPLFLGYLRGVPFAWTFGLVKEWAFAVGALLLVYLVLDRWFYRREDLPHRVADATQVQPLRLAGRRNFLWLAGVIGGVAFLTESNLDAWLGESPLVPYLRDGILVLLGLGALATTPARLRAENEFTWGPIVEVATLFFGIFLSMMAAIQLLHVFGPDLPVKSPREFFWATGALSSFLDNAPTYVVFFETAKTLPTPEGMATVAGVSEHLLAGVSLGAVFMGAMTYIGNAPNFMVKAIAEERQVPMPSFFGYMLYSCGLLLPIFWGATLIFLD